MGPFYADLNIMQAENMQFGIFLRSAMQIGMITQADLATKAGISQGAISRYLNGKASPKAEELYRLVTALSVSMEWLLTGQGPSPVPQSGGVIKQARAEAERLARELSEAEKTARRLRKLLG